MLPLTWRPCLDEKSLYIGPCHDQVAAMLDPWPWPQPIFWMHGPEGSGKTHLAAVWAKRHNATFLSYGHYIPGMLEARRCYVLDDPRFAMIGSKGAEVPRAVDALGPSDIKTSLLPMDSLTARDTPRAVDPLAALNASMYANPRIHELQRDALHSDCDRFLFHLLNDVHEKQSCLLICHRMHPGLWPTDLPDVRSRLNVVAQGEIQLPDDEMWCSVVIKTFRDIGIEISKRLAVFLAHRMPRSFASIMMLRDLVLARQPQEKLTWAWLRRAIYAIQQALEVQDQSL
jgi:hypothetical protein